MSARRQFFHRGQLLNKRQRLQRLFQQILQVTEQDPFRPDQSCTGHMQTAGRVPVKRQQAQKHKLKTFLESRGQVFNENLSERDNMINNGYRIYYDTGNLVYHKKY